MQITASMVKELRDKTGAGMMDCKKALSESEGEYQRAVDILREKGIAKAASKAGRATSEGLISSFVSKDQKSGAMLEVSCETDFVARTDEFRAFCSSLVEQLAGESSSEDIETFRSQPFGQAGSGSVDEALTGLVAKLGENMKLSRIKKLGAKKSGAMATYIHAGDKLGAMVEFDGVTDSSSAAFAALGRDIAMHIAAANPRSVNRDAVDQSMIDKEKEIYRQQALNQGKPEKIIDRIVDGKIGKFYTEVVLLEQPFVKDPDQSVGDLLKSKSAEIGENLTVVNFVRLCLGE